MGTKYTSQSSSGYNAGNPPDDGTEGTNNLITWTGIRTSLADVLLAFSDNINTELLSFFNVNTIAKSTAYTTVEANNGVTIECTANAPITLGNASTMTTGYKVTVKCVSGTTLVKVAGGDTLDGSTSDRSLIAGLTETYTVNQSVSGYLVTNGILLTATAATGTDDTSIASTGFVQQEIDATSFTTTARTTYKVGNDWSQSHGKGILPTLINAYAICQSTDQGYSVGNKIFLEDRIDVWANSAVLGAVIASTSPPLILHRTTGVSTVMAVGKWWIYIEGVWL
jgi:hypothetical protein